MPDITMCMARNCYMRGTCYRYRAIPDQYGQSYADYSRDCNERVGFRAKIIMRCEVECIPTEDVDAEYDRENDGH